MGARILTHISRIDVIGGFFLVFSASERARDGGGGGMPRRLPLLIPLKPNAVQFGIRSFSPRTQISRGGDPLQPPESGSQNDVAMSSIRVYKARFLDIVFLAMIFVSVAGLAYAWFHG